MAKMGRPPLGKAKPFQVRITANLMRRIKRLTKNISEFIRQALEEKLDRDEKK
jgi:Arc/MetJ-type ribon-helix-helix transcriptional regulator